MNNGEAPPAFVPTPFPQVLSQATAIPTTEPANGRKKKGGRRGPRQPVAAKPVKNGRRNKVKRGRPLAQPKSAIALSPSLNRAPKQQRAVKIDLAVAVSVMSGLQPDDTNVFQTILHMLQEVPAKARTRIVTALAKMVMA